MLVHLIIIGGVLVAGGVLFADDIAQIMAEPEAAEALDLLPDSATDTLESADDWTRDAADEVSSLALEAQEEISEHISSLTDP